MSRPPPLVRRTVRLDPDVDRKLDRLAGLLHLYRNDVIAIAIRHLNESVDARRPVHGLLNAALPASKEGPTDGS